MFLIPALLGLVSQVAPSLLSLLAGPKAGAVAQQVIQVAQEVTGKATPEDAAAALNASPEAVLKLRQELAQIALEHAQAEYADTASARQMAVTGGLKSPTAWGAPLLSVAIVALLAAVVMGWAPQPGDGLMQVLMSSVTLVLGFWFGSSKRDAQTDALLASSIPASFTGGGPLPPFGK